MASPPPPLQLTLPPPDTASSSSSWNCSQTPPKKKKRTKVFWFHQIQPSSSTPPKPKTPARKPDPSAPKITMPCSECGRKFWSWKALYGHMRCHPNRQWRGVNPPPNHRRGNSDANAEDYEAATCLLLLARGGVSEFKPISVVGGHKCGICERVFSTGQALGGHKRCHVEKAIVVPSGGGGGFDLNVDVPEDRLEDSGDDLQLVLRLGF